MDTEMKETMITNSIGIDNTSPLEGERDNFDYNLFLREYDRQQKLKYKTQIADEETIRRLDALEAEGKGIWATATEVRKATRKSKATIYRRLNKCILKKDSKDRILIWVPVGTNQATIEANRKVQLSRSIIEIELRISPRETYKVKYLLDASAEKNEEGVIIRKKIPIATLRLLLEDETTQGIKTVSPFSYRQPLVNL